MLLEWGRLILKSHSKRNIVNNNYNYMESCPGFCRKWKVGCAINWESIQKGKYGGFSFEYVSQICISVPKIKKKKWPELNSFPFSCHHHHHCHHNTRIAKWPERKWKKKKKWFTSNKKKFLGHLRVPGNCARHSDFFCLVPTNRCIII